MQYVFVHGVFCCLNMYFRASIDYMTFMTIFLLPFQVWSLKYAEVVDIKNSYTLFEETWVFLMLYVYEFHTSI